MVNPVRTMTPAYPRVVLRLPASQVLASARNVQARAAEDARRARSATISATSKPTSASLPVAVEMVDIVTPAPIAVVDVARLLLVLPTLARMISGGASAVKS